MELRDGRLLLDGRIALELGPEWSVQRCEQGVFLAMSAEKPSDLWSADLGVPGVQRFTACHRSEPFWMLPKCGNDLSSVPRETQSLLLELADGRFAWLIPLVDERVRASLEGTDAGLRVWCESGDPATVASRMVSLYVIFGEDAMALAETGSREVAAFLRVPRRHEKPVPAFADHFGWCTWDAFYQDVSHDKVREGLESFGRLGIPPKALILDDGWQSVELQATGEKRLTAFSANEKFPGGLAPTVQMAKGEFGVETFLVWHAFEGYWGGVDPARLPYDVVSNPRRSSEGILGHQPTIDGWFGPIIGLVTPRDVSRFYHDYHRALAAEGVDGVKVDNQAAVESVSVGVGGRCLVMRAYREALEGSVAVHFRGNLINCMSCANEMLYGARASNLTRTSTDFWPTRPETHGLHLSTNAHVGAWFGHFVHPDWDMFQSGHEAGAFHAAGRAVSGSPVYVSDKPDAHSAEILRRLVLEDGSVLRTAAPGVPTRDCLFVDPVVDSELLKVVGRNDFGAAIGVFHGNPTAGSLSTIVVPSDDLAPGPFAVRRFQTGEVRVLSEGEGWEVDLAAILDWEVFACAPIVNGVAFLGLDGMLNGLGGVHQLEARGGTVSASVRQGRECLIWVERPPQRILVNGSPATQRTLAPGLLAVANPGVGLALLEVTVG